jgi:hypothetical protein
LGHPVFWNPELQERGNFMSPKHFMRERQIKLVRREKSGWPSPAQKETFNTLIRAANQKYARTYTLKARSKSFLVLLKMKLEIDLSPLLGVDLNFLALHFNLNSVAKLN